MLIDASPLDDMSSSAAQGQLPQGQLRFPGSSDLATVEPTARKIITVDVFQMLLERNRSPQTQRAYERDLKCFFYFVHTGKVRSEFPLPRPTPQEVQEFLELSRKQIAIRLNLYKAELRNVGLADNTINRNLAAVRALLSLAHVLEICETDGRDLVASERVQNYRDTSGISLDLVRKLLKLPQKLHKHNPVRMRRDTAILILLFENGLRRAEISKLDVSDFSFATKKLAILGKGKGKQKQFVTLSANAAKAIFAYLEVAGHGGETGPLFRNLHHDPNINGKCLSGDGLYHLMQEYGSQLGVKNLTPHKMRHSAITVLAKETNGNLEQVQRFSRHADLKTVQIYIDNVEDTQGKMTNLLSDLGQGTKRKRT